jgi:hypothetical protein
MRLIFLDDFSKMIVFQDEFFRDGIRRSIQKRKKSPEKLLHSDDVKPAREAGVAARHYGATRIPTEIASRCGSLDDDARPDAPRNRSYAAK